MKPGEYPTPGCTETEVFWSAQFGYLGQVCSFCLTHGQELYGVRHRISALLAQIEGIKHIQANAGIYCNHATQIPLRYIDTCLRCRLHKTLQAQAEALLGLVDRERELTGADKP